MRRSITGAPYREMPELIPPNVAREWLGLPPVRATRRQRLASFLRRLAARVDEHPGFEPVMSRERMRYEIKRPHGR